MSTTQAVATPDRPAAVVDRALPILPCPACAGELTRAGDALRCAACAVVYLCDRVVRFVDRETHAESFGLTFETYATELESCHRPKEVFRWFREVGLTEIDLLDSDDDWVSVRGLVPARGA